MKYWFWEIVNWDLQRLLMYPALLCKVTIFLNTLEVIFLFPVSILFWNQNKISYSDRFLEHIHLFLVIDQWNICVCSFFLKNRKTMYNLFRCLCSFDKRRQHYGRWDTSFLLCWCSSWFGSIISDTLEVVHEYNRVDIWRWPWVSSLC